MGFTADCFNRRGAEDAEDYDGPTHTRKTLRPLRLCVFALNYPCHPARVAINVFCKQ